jgi:hypothetical protein
MLAVLTFRPRVILYQVLLGLGLPRLMLAMLGIAWAVKDPGKLAATGTGIIVDIYFAALVLVFAALARRVPFRLPFRLNLLALLLGYSTAPLAAQ